MAKSNTDRAVIDLVINGQQSKASLKEVSLAATRARSELLKMKEVDDPKLYQQKVKEYQALAKAQQEMAARINVTSSAWSRFKSNVASTALGLVGGNLIQTGLQAIIGVIPAAIGKFREFNAASQELSAVTGATGADLEYLNRQASKMGPAVGKSGAEMLEAYKLMASAKPELLAQKELLVETTKAAITLSQAGKIDLAEATSVTAESLNQFGESADQANRYINVIAAGAKEGSAEINEMGIALKNSGTVAAAQGVSFEQTNAILQSLSTIALKGGEAGTQLRNVLLTLGSGANDTNPRIVGLEKALENLGKKNLSTAEMTKLFGKENITAAQHIIAHRAEIGELTKRVTGTSEAFTQAEANNKSFDHQLEVFWARLSGIGVTIGTMLIPALNAVLGFFNDTADGLNTLLTPAVDRATDAFQDQKAKVTDLTKNLSPLLDRHDELAKKSVLTKDEQLELKKIVGQVAEIVPTAVTEWDKYGNALGVNTQKAREFIEIQKEMLKYQNQTAIAENKTALSDLEQRQQVLATKLNSGTTLDRNPARMGGYVMRQLTKAEIAAIRSELQTIDQQIKDKKELLSGLSGDYLSAPSSAPAATPTKPTGSTGGGSGKSQTDEEKKKAEEIKKANRDMQLEIDKMKADAIVNDRQRELAQAAFQAEREQERINSSKANADLKAKALKQVEEKLEVDKLLINKKYDEEAQKQEIQRLEDIRTIAAEELRITRDVELAKIKERVALGALTDEQGKQAELLAEQAYLRSKEILYGQHYEALAMAAWGNKEQMDAVAKQIVKDSADIEAEKTKNLGDQALARADIRKSELEHEEEMSRRKKQMAEEETAFRQMMINQTFGILSNDWSATLDGYKDYWKKASVVQKAALVAEKAYALAMIGINLQKQLSMISVMGAAMNALIPGSGTATIIAGYAKAIGSAAVQVAGVLSAVSGANATPAFAEGGFTGSGDGPSGYVNGPTMFSMGNRRYLAGEAGREFIISNKSLQNPVVANFARMMDVAQKSGNYSQVQAIGNLEGSSFGIGSTAQPSMSSNSDVLMMRLIQEQQLTRAAMEQRSSQNVALNYRLFEQYRDNLESARIENSL